MTSQMPYDTYPEVVINHAKFDISTFSSFKEVEALVRMCVHTYVQTELRFVY